MGYICVFFFIVIGINKRWFCFSGSGKESEVFTFEMFANKLLRLNGKWTFDQAVERYLFSAFNRLNFGRNFFYKTFQVEVGTGMEL